MAGNSNLNSANKNKKDEFYTQLVDIELELKHYRKHFAGKTVFCNCDDPYESNFFKYFAMNFNFLGLKKLVATCFKGSPIIYEQLNFFGENIMMEQACLEKKPYKIEITEVTDADGDGAVTLADVEYLLQNANNSLTLLQGDGDFRSPECVEILKEADIVVTNPPFSLFREFMAQLIEYNKRFIIIGNVNAITYKEIFPLIKDNKLWMGYSIHSGDREFRVPDDYPLEAAGCRVDENGCKYIRVKGVRWFTNLDYVERHKNIELYKKYTPEEYPKYDNYDAINVDKVAEIPMDYFECMGVPITFLDKYNPEQFEIINANDIRTDTVLIRPKTHGLIKDKEATVSVCSQNVNVERERERERERETEIPHNLRSHCYQTQTITNRTCLPVGIPASMVNENTPVSSSVARLMSNLLEATGLSADEIVYFSGVMGVPITFLDKYNPDQFEIIGCTESEGKGFSNGLWDEDSKVAQPLVSGERKYKRMFIKRK